MMNDLLSYCEEHFYGNGGCCDCDRGCTQRCEDCLRAIHWDTGERYSCDNSILFYVGKHVPRYASEIRYLLELTQEIRDFENFKVLSLGCGPCSDLWGIVDYNINSGLNLNIHYVGYDVNDIWRDIVSKNREILTPIRDFRLRYGNVISDVSNDDFFEAIRDRNAIRANLVVLQYVISDMVKNRLNMNVFLNNLYSDLIDRLPVGAILILNDINHHTAARDYFDSLCRVITRNAPANSYEFRRYHFINDFRPTTYAYGTQHRINRVLYNIPDNIRRLFDPWSSCQSAQLLIRKIR